MTKCVSILFEEGGPDEDKIEEAFDEAGTKVSEWEKEQYQIETDELLLDKKDLLVFISALFQQESTIHIGFLWAIETLSFLMIYWSLNIHFKMMWELSLDPILKQSFYARHNFLLCYK